MSRKTRDAKQQQTAAERFALRRRRWLLGVLILFQFCVAFGSQGAWYTAVHEEQELWTVSGPEYALRDGEPEPAPTDGIEGARLLNTSRPAQEPEPPGFFAQPGRLAALALFGAIVGFFFASFDLVADANIQWPILISCGVICLAAGLTFQGIYLSQATLGEIIEEVESVRSVGGGDVAAVTSAAGSSLLSRLPSLRLDWGSSLLFAAAPLMTLVSAYLTFSAARTPERS